MWTITVDAVTPDSTLVACFGQLTCCFLGLQCIIISFLPGVMINVSKDTEPLNVDQLVKSDQVEKIVESYSLSGFAVLLVSMLLHLLVFSSQIS